MFHVHPFSQLKNQHGFCTFVNDYVRHFFVGCWTMWNRCRFKFKLHAVEMTQEALKSLPFNVENILIRAITTCHYCHCRSIIKKTWNSCSLECLNRAAVNEATWRSNDRSDDDEKSDFPSICNKEKRIHNLNARDHHKNSTNNRNLRAHSLTRSSKSFCIINEKHFMAMRFLTLNIKSRSKLNYVLFLCLLLDRLPQVILWLSEFFQYFTDISRSWFGLVWWHNMRYKINI